MFHHRRVQFKTHNNCQTFSCLISLARYIHSEPQNHHPRQERPPCSKCSWRLNGPTEKICTCDPQIAHRLDKILQYKIQFVCFLMSVCLLNWWITIINILYTGCLQIQRNDISRKYPGSGKSGPKDQVALHYYYTSPSHWCTTHAVSYTHLTLPTKRIV